MRPERGSTLPAALLGVMCIAIIAGGSIALLRGQVKETLIQTRSAQAQAIAEAGLEDALNRLALNSSWKTGYSQKLFAGGYYDVTVSTDQMPWVISTGYSSAIPKFGRVSRSVGAQALFDGFYNYAASSYTVLWATTAFDSLVDPTPTCRATSMNASGCRFGDHVHANDAIETSGSSIRINGDATYANEFATAPAQSTIAGRIILGDTTVVDVEDATVAAQINDVNSGRISPWSAYSPTTKALSVTTATGNVSLSSGTYYFSEIYVSSRTLTISMGGVNSGHVANIYVASSVFVSPQGSIVSNCGSCRRANVHIFAQGGGTITISGYSDVGSNANTTYLDIHAPTSPVILRQRMLGRLIGKTVRIENPYGGGNRFPVFFFDLQYGFAQATGSRWVSGTWSETP